MRKIFLFLFLFVATVLNAQVVPQNLLPEKPANARPVVDLAGILSDGEESALVTKLKDYNDSTSNQVVIVTVKTLHGYASDQYATEIGHYWGVGGQEKKDNGVVILLSTGAEEEGKRKVFIATGYGLEGSLSAIVCKKITDNEMVPFLKQGKYYQAFDNAINAIMKAAAGEYQVPDDYKGSTGSNQKDKSNLVIIIIGFVVVIVLAIIRGRRGGGNGGMMSRRGVGNVAEALFWSSIFSGGNSGGGGSSSSDSGSGGFGSFGGGDFGGGGAGSDW